MQLVVYGNASQSIVKEIILKDNDLEKKLMDLLIENDIPVASSCSGANVCKLCNVNEEVISCQVTTNQFIKKFGLRVILNYL